MTTEEKIEMFVLGTKTSFDRMVQENKIDVFTIGRKIHFLVEREGRDGITTPFDLPVNDTIKGIILVSVITQQIKHEEGCTILCGCEILFNEEDNKLHLRFSSEVTGYDEEFEINVNIKPQSVRDMVFQMGICNN